MSEDRKVKDIYPDFDLEAPQTMHFPEQSLFQQVNTANTRESREISQIHPHNTGARPKQYTSTPAKFCAEDSVFSESGFEQKSKSDLDSLIRRQLEKINAVTEKYEKIASSKLGHLTSEHLLSLYGESEFPLSHTSVCDDDIDSSLNALHLKPVLSTSSQEQPFLASDVRLQSNKTTSKETKPKLNSDRSQSTKSKGILTSQAELISNAMYQTTDTSHTETKPAVYYDRLQSTKPGMAFTLQHSSEYGTSSNSNNLISQNIEVNNPLLKRDRVPCSVSDNLRPKYPALEHFLGSVTTKANENLPVTVQTNINFAADSLTTGSQSKQRSQSTKQSASLPFTLYTSADAKELKPAATREFITANNIHLQSTLNSRSQSNQATIQSTQVAQPHYPAGQLYQTENIAVTGHNTIPFTCYTSCQCTSSLANGNTPSVRPFKGSSFTSTCTNNPVYNTYAQQTGHFTKRKEKEPDKFDGRNVEYRDFIAHFETVALWNKWDQTEKAQQLAMCLRGQAQKLLGELKPNELNDYDHLRKILSQRYDPQERSVAYRCEFRSRKRQKNENPSDFAYALKRLACLAYPEMPYDCREINVLEQYLNNIGSSDLKEHVIFRHPKSVDEAIAYTVEYEAVKGIQVFPSKPKTEQEQGVVQALKSNQNSKSETTPNIQSSLNDLLQALNVCMEKWNKTLHDLQCANKNKSRKRNTGYSKYTCFSCHETGHIARSCPNKQTRKDEQKSDPVSEN